MIWALRQELATCLLRQTQYMLLINMILIYEGCKNDHGNILRLVVLFVCRHTILLEHFLAHRLPD